MHKKHEENYIKAHRNHNAKDKETKAWSIRWISPSLYNKFSVGPTMGRLYSYLEEIIDMDRQGRDWGWKQEKYYLSMNTELLPQNR